jgi:N-acetylglucosamine kinase-like BadF-type ATPase
VSREYLLGVDVGGSRTRALVADTAGCALGFGEAGPGNHEVVGYEGLFAAMQDAVTQAIAELGGADDGVERSASGAMPIVGAGFGVAGFDWESERADTMMAIEKLGLRCPVELRNDAALGLAAGASEGWGINISAGTSNNCYGRTRDGRVGRISGAGAAFGENGGAVEILGAALVSINHARILRGPPTALTAALCARAGVYDADALVEGLACRRIAPSVDWVSEVFEVARSGDEVARGIIAWAGRELGESAVAVTRQLGLERESFEVVLSGSLFAYEPRLEDGVAAVLAEAVPGARLVRLEVPPVVGAVVLGAEAAGLDGRRIRTRLCESVSSVLKLG